MPERHLPDRPNLDQLKHQAKDLLRDLRRGEPSASAAFQKHHPERPDARTAKLADAQFVVARSYGAPTWPRLVLACHIIDAIWRNDGETVRDLALKEPAVLHTILASPRGQTLLQSRFAIRQLLQSVAGHVRPPRGAVMGAAEPLNARGLSYLLEMGAEICDDTGDWRAPVALILETYSRHPAGKHECLELMVSHGIELPDTPPMAVHRGRIDLLAEHLARDVTLLTRTFSHQEIYPPALGCHADERLAFQGTPLGGATLLHFAVDYGELEIARWLLESGMGVDTRASLNAEGFGGHTALFSSVVSYAWYVRSKYAFPKPSDDPVAQLLLDAGADPNLRASLRSSVHVDTAREYKNVTPLSWGDRFHARELVSLPAMRMIVEHGGKP
jgi:hypothetical protein